MSTPSERSSTFATIQLIWVARVLLISYALVLPIRGTATLQGTLLLCAFLILLWEHRHYSAAAWIQARWLLGPLIIFSLWVFAMCGFWTEPPLRSWDPSGWNISQPWFSLNQWRRDIGQPMIALLCGFLAFRDSLSKRWLFTAQSLLILVLAVKCIRQFHFGEMVVEGPILEGVNYWFKGTLWVRGLSRDNNFFSYVLLLLTPGVLWLVIERKPGWQGWWRIGILLLLFYLIFLNKRRGTILAVYLELILIMAWTGKRKLAVFIVGTLLIGLAAYHFRPLWFQREYDVRSEGRIQILQDLPPLLIKHPWIGVGFGKDTIVKNYWYQIYQHPHNTFADIALGVGFPGLALWITALWVYGQRFWKAQRKSWSTRIGFALLIVFSVRNFTDDIWLASNAELFWFLLGVFMPEQDLSKE